MPQGEHFQPGERPPGVCSLQNGMILCIGSPPLHMTECVTEPSGRGGMASAAGAWVFPILHDAVIDVAKQPQLCQLGDKGTHQGGGLKMVPRG